MEPQAAPFTPRLSAATAVLLVVFSGAWFMVAMEWIPATFDGDGKGAAWLGRDAASIPLAAQPVPVSNAGGSRDRIACDRCGVIQSVRQVEKPRNPPGVASLSGGQAGEVMTVLQMVLNAMVGNTTGGARHPSRSYEITVRFSDGSTRMLTETGAPAWKPGDAVKVINGRLKPGA